MAGLLSHTVDCPYCGEHFEALIDSTELDDGSSTISYIEDCNVCCRPIHFWVSSSEDGDIAVTTRSENE